MFRVLIRQERLRPDSIELATDIKRILNNALERLTARFLNKHYAKLETVRERVLQQRHLSGQELQQDFENKVLFEEQEPLKWVQQHLLPIQLLEFSKRWESVKLKKHGYTEALLQSYFNELFFNVFKYSDHQQLSLRFYELEREGVTYLQSAWENSYTENTSISTGEGLKGISEDLRILNESEDDAKTLQIEDKEAQHIFRVMVSLRKDLLIFEPSKRKHPKPRRVFKDSCEW